MYSLASRVSMLAGRHEEKTKKKKVGLTFAQIGDLSAQCRALEALVALGALNGENLFVLGVIGVEYSHG